MIDHIIILILSDIKIKKSAITTEISQSSLFLLILYLFYIAELLNFCNNNNKKLSTSIFINDIILLIYEFSTEINCYILTQAYN